MLKKKIIPMMLLALLLAGCGNTTSSPSESDSDDPISSETTPDSESESESESEVESESESESEVESESESESEPEVITIPQEVLDKIGSKQNMRNYFDGEEDPQIYRQVSKIEYLILEISGTKTTSKTVSTTFNTNAVLKNVTYVDNSNSANSYNYIKYRGVGEDVYYTYDVYTATKKSTAMRYKLTDRVDNNFRDQMTASDANSDLKETQNDLGIFDLYYGDGNWKAYLNSNSATVINWDVTTDGNTYYVESLGFAANYNDTLAVYTTQFEFDLDLNLTGGNIITTVYNKEDVDTTTGEAKEDATFVSQKATSLMEIHYDALEETSVLVDNKYFMTGASNITITSTYDDMYGDIHYSEPNAVFADSVIDYLAYDSFTYTPSTALDIKSLVITSSSNEEAIYHDGFGWVAGKKDTTTTLTLGNSFKENLATVEVSVVANPDDNGSDTPGTSYPRPTWSEWDPILPVSDNASVDMMTSNVIVECLSGDKAILGLPTSNEGPFDLSGYTVSLTLNMGNARILEDQAPYYQLDPYAAYYVYVELTIEGFGNITISVWGPTGDEPIKTFTIITKEGGGQTSTGAAGQLVNSFVSNLKSQLDAGQGFTYEEVGVDGDGNPSATIHYNDAKAFNLGSALNLLNALGQGFIPAGLTAVDKPTADGDNAFANYINAEGTAALMITITSLGNKLYDIVATGVNL